MPMTLFKEKKSKKKKSSKKESLTGGVFG